MNLNRTLRLFSRARVARVLTILLVGGLMGGSPYAASAAGTFTVPTSPIAVNEQTPTQVFPGITLVDSGTNYSGSWVEYAVDASTSADALFLETATVASTTTDSITVVDTTVFKGNGSAAVPIGTIDGIKDGKNGRNLRINFTNTFSNGNFSDSSSVTNEPVVSLTGWTAYKERVKLNGGTNIGGFATPSDGTFPATTDSTANKDSSGATNQRFTVDPTQASRSGSGYSVKLETGGNCVDAYCIIRGPYIMSNSAVYLQNNDVVKFWWSALAGSDAFDVYGYLLNTSTGATIELLNSTGATSNATSAWAEVTKTITSGQTGNYKFVFIVGTWDATGGRAEGATLLLDDVSVSTSASATTNAQNLQDLSLLLRYSVTNDAPATSRTVNITTEDGATGGVQTLTVTPVNDPIAMEDPGYITRLRDMTDTSTATGTFVAYDPDSATATPVPATFRITGGTFDAATSTDSQTATYGTLTVNSSTGAYSYAFLDTVTALGSNSYETFTITAFDGIDTATGQLKIRLLGTLPPLTSRTLAFTVPSPLSVSKSLGNTFTVTAVPSAGLSDGTVTYSVGASTACTVSGSTVTITAATGTCTVTASVSAGRTYALANTTSSVTVTIVAAPAAPAVVAPTRISGPFFGEPVREIGGYTVEVKNYNPNLTNVISVSAGTFTFIGPVDGKYFVEVRGLTDEATVTIRTSAVGATSEEVSVTSGPLYIQVITLDTAKLDGLQVELLELLKPLTTVTPFGAGVTYASLTPSTCQIEMNSLVSALKAGKCTLQATGNPSPKIKPGAFVISSFMIGSKTAAPAVTAGKSKVGADIVVSFKFAKSFLRSPEASKLQSLPVNQKVTYKVVGYAQKNNAAVDLPLSWNRALEVRDAILALNPKAKVSVLGLGSKSQPLCKSSNNKCVVITRVK